MSSQPPPDASGDPSGASSDPYRFGRPAPAGFPAYGPRRGNGMAVAGLVLGILAARRGATGHGMAVAGLTCAIVGAVGATAFTIWALTDDRSCSDRYDPGTYRYEQCIRD